MRKGRAKPVSLTLETILDRCKPDGDCLLWVQGISSSEVPYAWHEGKSTNLRRLVYTLSGLGIAPGRRMCVSCDNPRCLRLEHLAPLTRKQMTERCRAAGAYNNPADVAKRTAARRAVAKLSMEAARLIRAAEGSHREIAAQFGVHHATVRDIRRGVLWKETPLAMSSVFGLGAA